MKHLLLTSVTIAALTAPALAQSNQSEMRNGERHLTPKDKSTQNEYANLIQSRAIEMGFFSWSVPQKSEGADHANRPRQVSDCNGHDAEYRPAHDFSGSDDWRLSNIGISKAFIYEWMAYGNAIAAQECTCETLRADWEDAIAAFDTLVKGIENFKIYTTVPHRVRNEIKRDYDQMCDLGMTID
ncbi:hypothetical protein [Sedimentitalea todarodis]|uniref:Uncharacterized protein n=1 Tax=Sedimentitalea todarodis TaxID=1631240 RepID=A0ABU3VGR9_9RHOB|nr:hypothetical protein [Sedimentitalea todarodis]MDU9005382.1 hypothetical protein [Sedimentitalea todarodis]